MEDNIQFCRLFLMSMYMTKSVKTSRKYQRKSRTIRRRYRGSGATASRQSAKTKDPMDELNTIDNEKKNMIVYKKMLSTEKLAPGTIGVDFTKNPKDMKIPELKASLHVLGIKTTQNEKDEIVKELKEAYLETSNEKIDALLDKTIVKARKQIVKYLKEQEENQWLLKQKERELQEKKRRAERALRKEQERISREQAEIAKLNAEIKEFEDMDDYQNRDRMAYYPYSSHYRSCSRCPNCSHCSHYSHYSPKSSTKITGKVSDGVYIGETKYY